MLWLRSPPLLPYGCLSRATIERGPTTQCAIALGWKLLDVQLKYLAHLSEGLVN